MRMDNFLIGFALGLVLVSGYVKAADYSGEIALGANISKHMPWSQGEDGGFEGPIDTVRFSLRADYSNNTFVQYSHISHMSAGWPIDDREENWLDVVEFGVKFRF